jgi:hypothetical protein
VSWVCDDATELVSGGWLTSAYAGHGILAEDIPSTGDHGASVLFDQITLPGDVGKELRALILTEPSGLTSWFQDEDGSVVAEAPDGAYSYSIQVYVDGVALGTPKTVTLSFGVGGASVGITGTAGVLSAEAQSVAVAVVSITGSAGVLGVVAGSGASAGVAISATAGDLAAAAGVAAFASIGVTGSAGTLYAVAGGLFTFVMPEARNLIREQAELRFVREPAERRTAREPAETRFISR